MRPVSCASSLPVTWQKSRRSNPSGNCVELGELPGGAVIAMRDSKNPHGHALMFSRAAMADFIGAVRDGEFA